MRVLLAQLAPRKGDVAANAERAAELVAQVHPALAVFPELYLSGYRLGDRFQPLALREVDARLKALAEAARSASTTIVVGAPVAAARAGEVHNAALLLRPDGSRALQVKRYLPTYGPFEEGSHFTPTDRSAPVESGGHRLGLEICYDAFFPEVSRELALAGAELLVAISAAPVTSRRLFEKVLPARAVENAAPLVYVNRVGVEDGIVFGGGSVALDARGEPLPLEEVPLPGGAKEEGAWVAELDLSEAARWRPFRPVLRDVSAGGRHRPTTAVRTDDL